MQAPVTSQAGRHELIAYSSISYKCFDVGDQEPRSRLFEKRTHPVQMYERSETGHVMRFRIIMRDHWHSNTETVLSDTNLAIKAAVPTSVFVRRCQLLCSNARGRYEDVGRAVPSVSVPFNKLYRFRAWLAYIPLARTDIVVCAWQACGVSRGA